MINSAEIIAGKMAVQLRLASADQVRRELRGMAAAPDAPGDLADKLAASRLITADQAVRLKELVTCFERARTDGAYLRLLEREAESVPTEALGAVLHELHRRGWPLPVAQALVRVNLLTPERSRELEARHLEALAQEEQKVLARYKKEDFAGVSKALTSGGLEPDDLSLFKLFGKGIPAVAHALRLQAGGAGHSTPPPSSRPAPSPPPSPTPPLQARPAPIPMPALAPPKPKKRSTLDIDGVKALKRIADYVVVQLLGAGGMGAVFLAEKQNMGVFVAIKVMLDDAATEVERKRFLREIALGKRVDHPFVMSILDDGETPEGLTFLVVPALVGKELRALITAAPTGMPAAAACRTFVSVLEGVQAIHDAGIFHRDLKPENIMVLAGDAGVKIMDFGLARLEGEADPEDVAGSFKTSGDEVSGSPAYMAPESIRRREIDRRVDIYALGVIFYEMLTGKLPFESDSPTGFLTQHVAMPAPSLADTRPEVAWPPAAEQLIERLLAKTADERPASCREVIDLLRGGLAVALAAPAPRQAPAPEPEPAFVPAAAEEKKFATKGILGRLMGR